MQREAGFTLIEVLVALTVLAIGLLGVAGMQTTAISANFSARQGTTAIHLAAEMVDRLRLNSGNHPEGYDGIDTAGTCGGSEPALGDCRQWQSRLQTSGLANAVGTVAVTAESPIDGAASVRVTLRWGAGSPLRTVIFDTILDTWGS